MGYARPPCRRRPAVRHRVRLWQRRARRDAIIPSRDRSPRRSPTAASPWTRSTAVANCHLHADHAGQNWAFPERADLRPARRVGDRPHPGPHDPRVDRLRRRADYQQVAGDHEPSRRASGSWPRRVTRPGHQSLVGRDAPTGRCVLAGQAVLHAAASGPASADDARGPIAAPRTRPPTTARSLVSGPSIPCASASATTATPLDGVIRRRAGVSFAWPC